MKKTPLVHVKWLDSCSPIRKWHDPGIGAEFAPAECESVGWVLRRDKKTLVLSASRASEEVGDITAIPASCVVRVRKLK